MTHRTPHITPHEAEQLATLWSGNADAAEEAKIRAWIDARPDLADDIACLESAWSTVGAAEYTARASAVQAGVLQHVTAAAPATISRPTRHVRGARTHVWRAGIVIAAVTVLAIGLPPLWRHVSSAGTQDVTFTTQRAERTTVQLPDGSSVLLGPETQLRYSSDPERQARSVELVGQGYFTVAADAKRAFVIQAGGVPVRVLGTSFSVRAYAGDPVTQVAVAEGKVAVGAASDQAILLAGDLGTATPGKSPLIMHNVRMADALGWTRGRMTFTDVPFEQVAVELQRMYDVTIDIADPALETRLITVTTTDDVRDVFDAIAIALDASWRGEGTQIVFSSGRTGE